MIGNIVMILIGLTLIYLGIFRKMEPLLLVPIGFGAVLVNIPNSELGDSGILYIFIENLIRTEIVPLLIFLGIGALTDFEPLIANPLTFLLGASAQIGVFVAFILAYSMGFTPAESASIGIIGGADGPTTIYITTKLAPHLLGATAVAAYSYMSLVPLIQPPVIKALTTKDERRIRMVPLRKVSKKEKIIFPVAVTLITGFLVPSALPLIGMLMAGNLFRESGVTDRLAKGASEELLNIMTIILGLSIGATMKAESFLKLETLFVLLLGVIAFASATAGGVILAKFMNLFLREKINPMIGAAGVSAVPMSARVVQRLAAEEDPGNFVLMHAMGPNVAGVIGTAVVAGFFIQTLMP